MASLKESVEKTLAEEQKKADRIIKQVENAKKEMKEKGKNISGTEDIIKEVEDIKARITKFLKTVSVHTKKLGEEKGQEFYDNGKDILKNNIERLNALDDFSKALTKEVRENSSEFEQMEIDIALKNNTAKQFVEKMKLEIKVKELNKAIKEKALEGKETQSELIELKKAAGELFGLKVFPNPEEVLDKNATPLFVLLAQEREPVLNELLLNPGEALKNNELLEQKAGLLETDPQMLRAKLEELDEINSKLQVSLDGLVQKLDNVSIEDMKNMLKRAEGLQEGIARDEKTIIDFKRLYGEDSKEFKAIEDKMKGVQNIKKREIYDLSNWQEETHHNKTSKIVKEVLAIKKNNEKFKDEKFISELDKRIEKENKSQNNGIFKRIFRKNSLKNLSSKVEETPKEISSKVEDAPKPKEEMTNLPKPPVSLEEFSIEKFKSNLEKAGLSIDENLKTRDISNTTLAGKDTSRRSSIGSTKSNESEKTISSPGIEK